jgi:2-keto-4-pentenoate hydratase/2-oxohepta-3-ene-1,7-dioic acid hydratase in catechol pathway
MRLANQDGRAVLVIDDHAVDVEKYSNGRYSADPLRLLPEWHSVRDWAAGLSAADGEPLDRTRLGPPIPAPPQVFGIGLNYRDHAIEANLGIPEEPVVFTKFPSCITGPDAEVTLPSESVDWEVELVVAISIGGHAIPISRAWEHVVGFMVGQDLSERDVQFRGPVPQFNMGKSFPGFAPTGPVLVTTDELPDPGALEISCGIDGETLQRSNTRELIFPVPELIAQLSITVTLLPGDLIFTGTPAGIGNARTPKRFLRAGETLTSTITGIGELHTRFTGP